MKLRPSHDTLINIRRGELKRFLRRDGVREIEILNSVENILAERRRWSADALGRRINLTFQDKLLLGIRTIQCVDRTPAEVKAHFRERKRTRDRLRKKKAQADGKARRQLVCPGARPFSRARRGVDSKH